MNHILKRHQLLLALEVTQEEKKSDKTANTQTHVDQGSILVGDIVKINPDFVGCLSSYRADEFVVMNEVNSAEVTVVHIDEKGEAKSLRMFRELLVVSEEPYEEDDSADASAVDTLLAELQEERI